MVTRFLLRRPLPGSAVRAAVAACLLAVSAAPAWSAEPVALSQVPVPVPRNLFRFVADRDAAARLGKALFWDMQLGSDGATACATCHFHAGADGRNRNTLHAGPDGVFGGGKRPNAAVVAADFPFVRFADPGDRN
jgi:cytochrome c peroxidase